MILSDTVISTPDVLAQTQSVITRAQEAGSYSLDGHEPSDEELSVRMEATAIASDIADMLQACGDAEILPLAECYDLLFRLGHGRMPDTSFMDTLYRRAFNTWKSGNRGIEESSVFAMIAPRIRNPYFKVDEDQAQAYREILDRWLDTLDRFGRFPDVTTVENLTRLSLLARHRIRDRYPDPTAARRRWYEANRIDDSAGLSPAILRAYRRFLSSMTPDVIPYAATPTPASVPAPTP